MTKNYFDAAAVVASNLDSRTPRGFFRGVDFRGNSVDYLVADASGNPVALVLTGDNFGRAWELEDGNTHRAGLSFGPVELQITGEVLALRPQAMDVIVSSTGAFVVVDRGGQFFNLRLSDVAAAGNPHEGFVVKHWRLIQRDHAGMPFAVFERDPEAKAT